MSASTYQVSESVPTAAKPTPPRLTEVHVVNRPPADLEVGLGHQALVGLDVVGGLWTANLQPYEDRADPYAPSVVRFRLGAWEPLVSEPEVTRVEEFGRVST